MATTPKLRKIVGVKELRENLEVYIDAVSKGKSFTVVRRSKPVFTIVPTGDEWGDEGTWETVADFTSIKKSGVPIEKVLSAFKK